MLRRWLANQQASSDEQMEQARQEAEKVTPGITSQQLDAAAEARIAAAPPNQQAAKRTLEQQEAYLREHTDELEAKAAASGNCFPTPTLGATQ